ncbi:MAG: hypothetical protein RMK50_07290, partial [Nitrososphaerota archaeon]|nr:hypothetical protein [Candidatus Bathyarchaeota archaeon]MDW8194602.1 hypothetical protein [Nitrososphaerota archaeon]
IAPQEPEKAFNFMAYYVLPFLTNETLGLLKTEIAKNPKDENLKKAMERMEAIRDKLREFQPWIQGLLKEQG